ncbi:MAG: HDIG domain-containing protein [bacterium]|nr:HDIG domain-containing protein [bacterium]
MTKVYFQEFLDIINPIINNKEFLKRKDYAHHENESVYDHSMKVSFSAYLCAKKLNLDYKSAAIGGLLHDFYYEDWQKNHVHKKFFQMHGFVHARQALENSKKVFPELMNKKVENIIVRHMFPLNIVPPKYAESWIVSLVDKKCSMYVLKHPKKCLKYVGIRKGSKS